MSSKGALSYRQLLQRLNDLDDGFEVKGTTKPMSSVRHLKRVHKGTDDIGRKTDGKPMITSISVKREGDEIAPQDIDVYLKALGVDRKTFWN